MTKCSNCGAELDVGAKFCMECGTPVPQKKKCVQCGMELPLKAKFCFGCGAPQEGSASQMTGISMGDKNVVAGDVVGQKVAGDNVQSKIMGNVINNTIHDETKKIISCHVCGRHLANDNAYTCPNCGKVVCEDHFNKKYNRCNDCIKTSLKKITVAEDGSGDFNSISEAIAFACDGTVVVVKPGVYKEHFVVDKEISLQGEPDADDNQPVIWDDTTVFNSVVSITANAQISNFRIMGQRDNIPSGLKEKILSSSTPSSVSVNNADKFWPKVVHVQSSCLITGVEIFHSAGYGIAVSEGIEDVKIKSFNIHDNVRSGFFIADDSKVSIELGLIYANNVGCIFHASNIFVWNANIFENRHGISATSSTLKMESCTVYANEVGCLFQKTDLLIKECSFGTERLIQTLRVNDNVYSDVRQNALPSYVRESLNVSVENSIFFEDFYLKNVRNVSISMCKFITMPRKRTEKILPSLLINDPSFVSVSDSCFKFVENENEALYCCLCVNHGENAEPAKVQISDTSFENYAKVFVFKTFNEGECFLQKCSFDKIANGVIANDDLRWKFFIDSCKTTKSRWTNDGSLSNIKFENKDKKEIYVSQNGQADFSTITEALNFAEDDSTIIVEYGEYQEHFVVDKNVTIIGRENERGYHPIVKESLKNVCICVHVKAKATLRNLLVKSMDKDEDRMSLNLNESGMTCKGIAIEGDATLENVWVSRWLDRGISVGGGANPKLMRCCMLNNGYGIEFTNGARGLLDDCEISNNICGIAMFGGNTRPSITNSIIQYSSDVGVVSNEANGSIINSKIIYNKSTGVAVLNKSHIHISSDEIRLNEGPGVDVLKGAVCSINRCDISSNSNNGICVRNVDTKVTVADCDVSINNSHGVELIDGAQGVFENCEITNNDLDGICLQDGNTLIDIKKCKILDNDRNGISFANGAGGNVEECRVANNKEKNLSIGEGCSPVVDLDTLFASGK